MYKQTKPLKAASVENRHIYFPQKLQLRGFHSINIRMSHTAHSARVKRFYSSVKRCPLCVPVIIAEQKHHVGPFQLIVSQYARLFPWKKTIPFPSDSRQIKQIYSLALRNFSVCQESSDSRPHLPVSGTALWQLKWNENYSGFWESAGPLDFLLQALSFWIRLIKWWNTHTQLWRPLVQFWSKLLEG